jgi:hypothetical protein
MYARLAAGWQALVAIVTSQYTQGTAIVAAGGAIQFIPALTEHGGAAVAAMGVYVLGKAIVASVKQTRNP